MFRHPFWTVLLERQAPMVELLDLRSDTTDLTTYTFSNLSVNFGGTASISGDDYLVNPQVRSRSRSAILMFIHAEDSATVFTVNACTLGGVAGTELTDINSGLVAATAAYLWTTDSLMGIANTDVSITFSEAITGCVISLLKISNIGVLKNQVAFNLNDPNIIPFGFDITVTQTEHNALLIGAFTVSDVEEFRVQNATGVPDPSRPYDILYAGNNGEFSYACIWSYSPQYNGGNSHAMAADAEFHTAATSGNGLSIGFV